MTGALPYALYEAHLNELRAAARKDRRAQRKPRGERRLPGLPRLRRPRRAFA